MLIFFFFAREMVWSRGKDSSIIRRGHVRHIFPTSMHVVPTSMHGHLIIELGNIPYSSLPLGFTTSVGGQQGLSHSPTPSSSSTRSNLFVIFVF